MAAATASPHAAATPKPISRSVTGSRAAISSRMGRFNEGDMPKSPCSVPPIW